MYQIFTSTFGEYLVLVGVIFVNKRFCRIFNIPLFTLNFTKFLVKPHLFRTVQQVSFLVVPDPVFLGY